MTEPETTESVWVDYFEPDKTTEVVNLPDGQQSVTIRKLNEGDRTRFQQMNQNKIKGSRSSDDLIFDVDSSQERKSLLKLAIKDWDLRQRDPASDKGWRPVSFDERTLEKWVEKAPIEIVDLIVQKIRLMNTWLLADVPSSQLRKQIDDLQELLVKREDMEEKDKSLPR